MTFPLYHDTVSAEDIMAYELHYVSHLGPDGEEPVDFTLEGVVSDHKCRFLDETLDTSLR